MMLAASYQLTIGGWIFMLVSVGCVTGLLGWSVGRVLCSARGDKLRSQMEIDPPDKTLD